MKKIFKSFTFWFIIIALIEIIMHQIGQDSKSIVLIGFNPILNMIGSSDGLLYNLMDSGPQILCNTISGQISLYWYIGSVITFAFYGAIIDCIKWGMRRLRTR